MFMNFQRAFNRLSKEKKIVQFCEKKIGKKNKNDKKSKSKKKQM